MMNKTTNTTTALDLIATEEFHATQCNFYKNMQGKYFLNREQIGQALEYTDPMVAIGKIHKRHQDRLDNLSFTILVNGHQTYYYTDRGVMEICRWSKSKRANEFMDWVWDIIEAYRNKSLNLHNHSNFENTLLKSLDNISDSINNLNKRIDDIENRKRSLDLPKKTQSPQSNWTVWSSKMMPKYDELKKKLKYSNNTDLYKFLYKKFNKYHPEFDLNQLKKEYCKVHRLNDCYTLDAIEFNTSVRTAFEKMVDNLISK